jgi:hypothetical protein
MTHFDYWLPRYDTPGVATPLLAASGLCMA